MTTNEPTVRYWRGPMGSIATFQVDPSWTPVHVLTEAELAAHTTAARAEGWTEAIDHIAGFLPSQFRRAAHADNPYRTTESED